MVLLLYLQLALFLYTRFLITSHPVPQEPSSMVVTVAALLCVHVCMHFVVGCKIMEINQMCVISNCFNRCLPDLVDF